ncbi:crotonase/enoyl-CoA hydratase family protein [Loktanella sp. F6476L]|uniref:crotonase/enoyl-CoA hydratase family protein n=1 Tax=Loktanella sp. F6476L TaxID=2926405 RepID=UPI001FF1C7A6|nr:crotonase/enoyl-CoA hydratase family protein [Loktanella sp. F6476L]MCK0120881.1 crotonase/enoyl-CoA hydratase family protein [Loktanella sp. F6476L]
MDHVKLAVDARGVATVSLARSEKRNALSAQMMDELTQMAAQLDADDAVRVVVLAAEGGVFCAGGDLGWMRAQMEADDAARTVEARRIAGMLQALNSMTKPLIGRVHADAFGGGVGICCVCDVVVASEAATFGLTETKLGLIPATIGPYVMARMGEGRARQVFMSSRRFDAHEAKDLGIVSRVVANADLDAAIAREVDPYLACAPGAVAAAKAYARSYGSKIDAATMDRSIAALLAQWASDEAQEGIAAFFEKRKPRWA